MDDQVITAWLSKRSSFTSDFRGTRVAPLPGSLGLVKAVNLERTGNKRKTRYEKAPTHAGPVTRQPIDPESFNFTRAKKDEFITDEILINVSPLAFGHFLFCPFLPELRPQVLSLDVVGRALRLASEFKRDDFKMFFNSLGGWASVNHLHFHGVFLRGKGSGGGERIVGDDYCLFSDGLFPIEKAIVLRSKQLDCYVNAFEGKKTALTVKTLIYPAECLVLESEDLETLSLNSWFVISNLLEKDIPHNVLISNQGRRIFIIPRTVQKPFTFEFSEEGGGLHVALSELCGYLICFDKSTYDFITETDYSLAVQSEISADPELISWLYNEFR